MKLIFNRTYWKPHCDAIGKKQPQCNNSVSRLHVHIKNLSLSHPSYHFRCTWLKHTRVNPHTASGLNPDPFVPFFFLSHSQFLIALGGGKSLFFNRPKVSFKIERLITTLFPVNDKIWFFGLSTSDVSFKFQCFNISWVVTIMNTRWHRDFRNHLNLTGSFDESNRRNGRNIRLCNRNPFEK